MFLTKCFTSVKTVVHGFFVNFFPKNFPKRKLLPLLLMLLIEAMSQTIINSYVGYLIVDMGMASTTNESGKYSGWLVSSFSIAQFLSSFFIGSLSDNFGRRPILLGGTFGIAICNVLFGFCTNYYYAISIRLLNGFLNGNVGVIKSYMGELTDDSNRTQTFNFIGLTWSVGAVFGNFMGGVLYNPVRLYPSLFGSSHFFSLFPALLPQLVVTFLGFFGLSLAYFYLLENERKVDEHAVQSNKFYSILNSLKNTFTGMFHFFRKSNLWSLFCSFEYFLLGFGHTTYMTIFPLLMIASVGKGGFGQTTKEVGYFSAISSVAGFFTTVFCYKPLVHLLGIRYGYFFTTFCTALFYGMYPSLEGLNGSSVPVKWLFYSLNAFCWNLVSQCSFSSIFTLIVNGADKDSLGSANGVAQSMASFGRVLGPIMISPLLSWGLTNGLSYPINQYLPFYIITCIGLFNAFLILLTPRSLSFTKSANKSEEKNYTELKETKIELEEEIGNEEKTAMDLDHAITTPSPLPIHPSSTTPDSKIDSK
ncbi:hypothetical protein EIN_379810 [Entamoeba invadens IP1]|uniref:Major facilitator superfamily (MFS) profile domain-containing protein n=1 Tax=Entamoeba invadens IP1 TaxID=370355 RepID=A0A0A1UG03_ENTIV|nr:hypothetical protein EIN_379810 [Entamoeba invadens IP1]ELP92094.1 hypothetical protein EIN_379810 [Entamoeba invadens IP1]|eukprot:XP_004258865.1 hypothetical protein EIN_379810 [Entamoeba invadens IP1]